MTRRALNLALRLSFASFASTVAAQDVDLGNLGERGFRIDGVAAEDRSGRSVSGAGDVNGDGLGRSVSGAGDINCDGLADLEIGATSAAPGGDNGAGESYVVFGKADAATVTLASLGTGGFRIDGSSSSVFSGADVAGAGDVNGDGLADVIIGAHRADPDGKANAGESNVVFSASVAPPSATVRARSANGNPPRTAFGISGNGSNHSTPDARAFIDFANGNDASASASTEAMTLTRSAGSFPEAAANASWALQTTRQNWTTAELRLRYLDSELLSADEGFFQIVFSADGAAPFTPLPSIVSAADNSITASITLAGVHFIGLEGLEIFADGFE